MPTFYLDYVNGNDAADGSTFALGGLPAVGPWKTLTLGATAARIAPGDIIRIAKSPDPTSLGQTALWTNLSRDVVLQTGAVTAEIDNCESTEVNWTESAGVTGSNDNSQYKLGVNSYKLVVAAAFAGGKAAYRDFGAGNEKNLSGYQQISFWIRNSVALSALANVQIKLCSDALGDTPVDTFDVLAIPSTGRWIPITINKGSALGSAIRSVAIYAVDAYAGDLFFDNIIACKALSAADALTLQSLISKNAAAQGGVEHWYPIQSINGTTIKIDNETNQLGNGGRGYTGTTETVTIYKRETIKTTLAAATTTIVQQIMDSGTLGVLIEFQGGYNTATVLQDGETLFDGLNGFGYGINTVGISYEKLNWLGGVRYYVGFYGGSGWKVGSVHINLRGIACVSGWSHIEYRQTNFILGDMWLNNNSNWGFACGCPGSASLPDTTIRAHGNMYPGLNLSGAHQLRLETVYARNNGTWCGVWFGCSQARIKTLITADNTSTVVFLYGGTDNYIGDLTYGETTVLYTNDTIEGPCRLFINSIAGVATDKRIYSRRGIVYSENSVRHTASGFAWKLSPTTTTANVTYPLWLKVAEVAVNANALVTVKAWLRRSNVDLTVSLVCRGGQLAGVPNDVVGSMTAAVDTWEEITITFTPTEAGVVEIEVWAYGGSTYSGYVDDMTFDQAA